MSVRSLSQTARRCAPCVPSRHRSTAVRPPLRPQPTPFATHGGLQKQSRRSAASCQRHLSTSSIRRNADPTPTAPLDAAAPPPPAKRSRRPYIYAGIFFVLGWTAGNMATMIIAPPPAPEPGSTEDLMRVDFVRKEAGKLGIVQALDSDPAYVSWEAYPGAQDVDKRAVAAARLTTGPLAGARGIGAYQRVWYDEQSGDCISVVFIGDATVGWPYVVHGGLAATLLDESLGRAALLKLPAKTGVTANFDISYVQPTVPNAFYVIRTRLIADGSSEKKQWVQGTLETVTGHVCVSAKALFVVPKGFTLETPSVGL